MANTIYLVKKDPMSSKENVEWIQMDGKEFYRFIHSEQGKGRYFIHLTDDVSYEADEIYIESSYEEFCNWKLEYNRHRYLKACEGDAVTLSADAPVNGGEHTLVETLTDEGILVDELVADKDMAERLKLAILSLPEEEQMIIHLLFFSESSMTEAQAGKQLGLSQQTLHYRKKKIISKLEQILFVKPGKVQQ